TQTDNKDIIPYIPNSYYTVDGERYDMTPDEYTQYKIDFGKFNCSQLESLFASDFYKNLTTEQKEEAITKVYNFSRDYLRKGKYYELYQLLGNNSKNLSTYLLTINSFTADLDSEGNPIPNSKKLKVFKYINSLPLSKLAKNKLFELAGYSTTSMQQDETQPKKIIRPRR
ncbi:MAG TPA: hypothetical protein GXZ48_06230, partial [Acholeplasmataceae bacterium]|nr:hypothetical protein [Acholeplasmataceae bacterium]